jgi:hypothetical protein
MHQFPSLGRRPPPPPTVALELQTTVIGESFKEKSSDLTALEVYLKGAAFVCPRWSAQLEAKCHERTFKFPVPSHRLPSKLVSRQQMARPRSRSLHPVHGVTSSDLCYFVAAPPDCSSVSSGFLWSTWRKYVDVICGCIGCHE